MSHSSKLSGTQELCPSDYCKSLRICDRMDRNLKRSLLMIANGHCDVCSETCFIKNSSCPCPSPE